MKIREVSCYDSNIRNGGKRKQPNSFEIKKEMEVRDFQGQEIKRRCKGI